MFTLPSPQITVDPSIMFDLPISYTSSAPLGSAFIQLAGKSKLNLSLHRAVHAATRYLYVKNKVTPDGNTVNNFRIQLLVELDTYFDFDLQYGEIKKKNVRGLYTPEHGRHASEKFAYGAALLLLEKFWPAIKLTDIYFIVGASNRPDFELGILGPGGGRLAIEMKSDSYRSKLRPSDITKLKKKRGNYEALLGVYFHHGRRFKNKKHGVTPPGRTRLVLADPSDDFERVQAIDPLLAALTRYLGMTREIGLHWYAERLQAAITSRSARELLLITIPEPFDERVTGRHPQRRRYGGDIYIGRVFSTLLSEIQQERERKIRERRLGDIAPPERVADLGLYSFVGIHVNVLRAIHESNWHLLVGFSTDTVAKDLLGNISLYGEGLVIESTLVMPGSKEEAEIRESI